MENYNSSAGLSGDKNPHGIPPSSATRFETQHINITFEMLRVLSSLWQKQ